MDEINTYPPVDLADSCITPEERVEIIKKLANQDEQEVGIPLRRSHGFLDVRDSLLNKPPELINSSRNLWEIMRKKRKYPES